MAIFAGAPISAILQRDVRWESDQPMMDFTSLARLAAGAAVCAIPCFGASAHAEQRETCRLSPPYLRQEGSVMCQPAATRGPNGTVVVHSIIFLDAPAAGDAKTMSDASGGDIGAMVRLSHFYRLSGDPDAALSWTRRAVAGGDPEAQYDLAEVYLNGTADQADQKDGIAILTRSADSGYVRAMAELGSVYAIGIAVPKDDALATTWFRRAAEHGSVSAMMTTGIRYRDGNGVSRDQQRALYWLQKAYDAGVTGSATLIAKIYDSDGADHPNALEAAKWYLIAAQAGDPTSMEALAEMYAAGRGVQKDADQARYWSAQAAKHRFVIVAPAHPPPPPAR
jgi:TPR repeat protein